MIDISYVRPTHKFIAGVDEVGRGPLAGPVVAATALVDFHNSDDLWNFLEKLKNLGITDSKKLTTKKRLKILDDLGIEVSKLVPERKYIVFREKSFTLSFAISEISAPLIDEINILNAALLGMSRSFSYCYEDGVGPLLIDGDKIPKNLPIDVESHAIIKGDSKSVLIALASIVAKEYRDHLMAQFAKKYVGYGFENHAGYPTKSHKEAILELGVTPIHRKSFRGVKTD